MTLPDYIIVGAMKCGTSTLAAQLGAQAGLFMTTPKEPNFFSDDPVYAKGMTWYQALFDAAAPGDLRGEASTHYTKAPTYPQTLPRLQQTGATPRIIYLIRDPLARAVSHYIHEWTQGVIGTDLATALDRHPEIESYGCYGAQIAPWVAAFGADRVLVLSMEAMEANPQAVLDRVGVFLGREGLVWQDDLDRVNASAARTRRFPLQRLLIDNPLATALRRTLVPQGLRDRIKASRQMQTRPSLDTAQKTRLKQVYSQDFKDLQSLFPACDDLALSYPWLAHD